MSTPVSATTAYATPSDMVSRYDYRSIAELLIDDENTTVTDPSLITATGQPLNTQLAALLQDASGLVEAACTAAGNYVINTAATPPVNDLAALTGNSQAMLKRMVCDLCLYDLWGRRPNLMPNELPPRVKWAIENLDKLRRGEYIFGILEHQAAGQGSDYVENATDVANRMGPVVEANRYFSRRNDQWNGGGFA